MIGRLYLFQTTITGISMNKLNVQVANRDDLELTDDQINELLDECGYELSESTDPLDNEPVVILMDDLNDFLSMFDDEDEEEELRMNSSLTVSK